jgi:DNA mismatch repair protein MutS
MSRPAAEADKYPDLSFSLLWPDGNKTEAAQMPEQSALDLDLGRLVEFMAFDSRHVEPLSGILHCLCCDEGTINYRLDIIDELVRFPALARCMEDLLPVLRDLKYYETFLALEWKTSLQEAIWRLRELEHYVECVQRLAAAFETVRAGGEGVGEGGGLRSQALSKLGNLVLDVQSDPVFRKLVAALPDLLSRIRGLQSITIGVNLDAGMMPCEATLVSINAEGYSESPFFRSLFGHSRWRGIGPLHRAPEGSEYASPLMVPLFRDVSRIMEKTTQPLAAALKEFVSINSRLLTHLYGDFLFYLGALKLIETLRACGLPVARPVVLDREQRRFQAAEIYNVDLALHLLKQSGGKREGIGSRIVRNDFTQDEKGRIIILTGPNRGGKTTFLQAIGLAQVMMQAGLYVPARTSAMSVCDSVLTHYPALEKLEQGTGRFGEEARRIASLFASASRHSLILLNESLSSTSGGEGLFLARDIVRVMRMLGARALYATHLHGLAASAEQLNEDTQGESRVLSMVARIETEGSRPIKPTFRIAPGPPEGRSYAIDLARRFGIGREQLVAALEEAGKLAAGQQGPSGHPAAGSG